MEDSSNTNKIRHLSFDLSDQPDIILDIRKCNIVCENMRNDRKKMSENVTNLNINEVSNNDDEETFHDNVSQSETLTTTSKKIHSLSYPLNRRRAIAPDETRESKALDSFHIFSPHYADWQKNYDALEIYKRRNSLPFYIPDSFDDAMEDRQNDCNKQERSKPWSLFKMFDKNMTKTKNSIFELDEVLKNFKHLEIEDEAHLSRYKNLHWSSIWPPSKSQDPERHLKNAIWELFTTECNFYFDNLLVLKNAFMEPLKWIQVDGHLMDAEPEILFGNLDELCAVTYDFCHNCIQIIEEFAFNPEETLQRIVSDKKNGTALCVKLKDYTYHKYCLNYINSLNHLYFLRNSEDFNHFERWCQNYGLCQKRSLSDLLISPVQHCMKIPLIYKNIQKKCNVSLSLLHELNVVVSDLEISLKELEEKMKWMKNYKRLQEVENNLIWPQLDQQYKATPFNVVLQNRIKAYQDNVCIANPRRRIIHEGNLLLHELNGKISNSHVFLFDDIILITRVKKTSFKRDSITKKGNFSIKYEVVNQLIDLDRFVVDEITNQEEAIVGVKNMFILIQLTKHNEIVFVYVFQAPTLELKREWVKKMRHLHKICQSGMVSKYTMHNPQSAEAEPSPDDHSPCH